VSVKEDMKLEHKWREPIKRALATHFQCAPQDFIYNHLFDIFGSADLVLGSTDNHPQIRIPLRVRRGCYLKYGEQFTLRHSRPSGILTECPKIKALAAAGHLMKGVYAIESVDGSRLEVAHVLDLTALALSGEIDHPFSVKMNGDESSDFNIYLLTQTDYQVIVIPSL